MTTENINGLDLDALEKEGAVVEAYTFRLNGREWTALDPEDIDWQLGVDLDVDNPREIMAAYLGAEQWAEFAKVTLEGWKIRRLVADIDKHYSGGVAPGEKDGLPQP